MKIFLVHNFYNSAILSGGNRVFLVEMALLRSKGHEAIEFARHSARFCIAGWRTLLRTLSPRCGTRLVQEHPCDY